MAKDHQKRLEKLQAGVQPVEPQDSMAEAGRKVLLGECIRMLQHEPGTRTGEDIEDVHQMRVAIRRMRSSFRLLKPYFKPKQVAPFIRELRRTAWVLGDVRDLDVMIDDLSKYAAGLDEETQAVLADVISILDVRRVAARRELVDLLDSKSYRQFLKAYTDFLLTPQAVKAAHAGAIIPTQVRHILPGLIYDRLGAVRAYETVLEDGESATLHALRIEFKRLRYAVSLFQNMLGASIDEFIAELKVIQDHLGRFNDISTAQVFLHEFITELDYAQASVLNGYIASLEAESPIVEEKFPEIWAHFNTRKVQQKLSSAVLALR